MKTVYKQQMICVGHGQVCRTQFRFFLLPLQTYIGTLLVSVNPYRELDIYSKKQMDTYMGVNFFELPPHMLDVFFRSMITL